MENLNLLIRFEKDFDRHGSVDGLFICTTNEYEKIKTSDIYLGEVLGKHSSVGFDNPELEILSDDQEFIAKLEETCGGKSLCGYNLVWYLQ